MPIIDALEMQNAAFQRDFSNQMELADQMARKPRPSTDVDGKSLVLGLVLTLAGILAGRKLLPWLGEFLNQRHDPWAAAPAVAADPAAESESFSKFVADFTAGPTTVAPETPYNLSPSPASLQPRAREEDSKPNNDRIGSSLGSARQDLVTIRTLFSVVSRAPNDAARQSGLAGLLQQVRNLKSRSGVPEMLPLWQMTCALEGLLNQVLENPRNASPSALRTIAGAVDLLHALCVPGLRPDLATEPPVRLLAVDDDPLIRYAVSFALKKFLAQPDLAADGEAALDRAEGQAYDVIFLDVEMPGMDGFELCFRIHGTALNQTTPVVFVTAHSDFGSRAKSSLTGGQDLLGKPFLTFELTVKALTLVLRRRLQPLAFRNDIRPAPNTTERRQADLEPAVH
jgi:CheY-like chemotaxis protein